MNKTKKISINEFENAVNEGYEEYITAEWRGLPIVIKQTLSLSEMIAFVDGVASACFGQEDMAYVPAAEDFAIRTAIIELYTNIRLPTNIHKKYDLLYRSDIVDFICNNVNRSQYEAIMRATHTKIDHISDSNVAAANKQFENLFATFENLQTQMEDMLEGVDEEDIKKLVGAIGNGKIDEDKIVKAYIDNK